MKYLCPADHFESRETAPVRMCLIASLIARVDGKVCSLSKSEWLVQLITTQSY